MSDHKREETVTFERKSYLQIIKAKNKVEYIGHLFGKGLEVGKVSLGRVFAQGYQQAGEDLLCKIWSVSCFGSWVWGFEDPVK